MLQLFHMDVAKIDWECCTCCVCCKCFRDMLQEFVQNVSSVPVVCCKRLGAGGRGHDRTRCERMGTGRIKVDGTDYEQVVRIQRRCDEHMGKTN
jgi:hypothetical protein